MEHYVFCVACRSSQTADESANRNKSSKQLAAINNLKAVMVTMGLFKLVPYFFFRVQQNQRLAKGNTDTGRQKTWKKRWTGDLKIHLVLEKTSSPSTSVPSLLNYDYDQNKNLFNWVTAASWFVHISPGWHEWRRKFRKWIEEVLDFNQETNTYSSRGQRNPPTDNDLKEDPSPDFNSDDSSVQKRIWHQKTRTHPSTKTKN